MPIGAYCARYGCGDAMGDAAGDAMGDETGGSRFDAEVGSGDAATAPIATSSTLSTANGSIRYTALLPMSLTSNVPSVSSAMPTGRFSACVPDVVIEPSNWPSLPITSTLPVAD